jgi:hypothetical protein
MAMAWHTTRGEGNSKQGTNETTMKEEQQRRMITVRSVWQMVVTNHVDDWRRLLYFYIWIGATHGEAPSVYGLSGHH